MDRTSWADLAISILVAVPLGAGLGLVVGIAARRFGLPTNFVGPMTGGLVSAMVITIHRLRSKRRDTAR